MGRSAGVVEDGAHVMLVPTLVRPKPRTHLPRIITLSVASLLPVLHVLHEETRALGVVQPLAVPFVHGEGGSGQTRVAVVRRRESQRMRARCTGSLYQIGTTKY